VLADNPLAADLERGPVAPTVLVIFGATGDLARRRLLPAVYALAHEGALPERFDLIAVSRGEMTDAEYRDRAAAAIEAGSRVPCDPGVLHELLARMTYVSGSFDDPATYRRLAERAEAIDRRTSARPSHVFYLSTAPAFFPGIVRALGRQGLASREPAEVRIVIEKPFGRDLASARALNATVHEVFAERQVFRIDHYLGKETVQNLLVLRFANGIFEPLWNRGYVDHVQITAAEDIGIGTRAGYYDAAGALRDIVQNHLLQLLTILAMEPPVSFSADEVRDEKVKVLRALTHGQRNAPPVAVRAQYGPGDAGGQPVPGYAEEPGVPAGSRTETFVALRLEVDNWRWAGVPFYLRTGKRLARRTTEVAVTLKPVPHLAFAQGGARGVQPNQLVLSVQPNEGVSLSLVSKIPGARMRVRPVNMEFLYGASFLSQSPEAYERLLLDAMRGDATLFARGDEVEAAWAVCDPVLERFAADPAPLPTYPAGSSGPPEADAVLAPGAGWRTL
jgi:glucose-6-phosphate 1-dehydrogenase